MTGFITNKTNLISTLRVHYLSWIHADHPSKLRVLSIEGTVAGAVQEVHLHAMWAVGSGVMVFNTSGYHLCGQIAGSIAGC